MPFPIQRLCFRAATSPPSLKPKRDEFIAHKALPHRICFLPRTALQSALAHVVCFQRIPAIPAAGKEMVADTAGGHAAGSGCDHCLLLQFSAFGLDVSVHVSHGRAPHPGTFGLLP